MLVKTGTKPKEFPQTIMGPRKSLRSSAVSFAVKVARERGHVGQDDLNALRTAGHYDAQIIEIVLHVALNTWANYVNEVAKTDIDFPIVTSRKAA